MISSGFTGRSILCAVVLVPLLASPQAVQPLPDSAPGLLSFKELVTLSGVQTPEGELGQRYRLLLETPFVSNAAYRQGVRPIRPVRHKLGPLLRVAVWNIERGSNYGYIRDALGDPQKFHTLVSAQDSSNTANASEAYRQSIMLQESDVVILNEVDFGMTRSAYRDVAGELARSLNMNYAFGVEFIEIDSLYIGTERLVTPDKELTERLKRDMEVDPARYRGLHGTAILTRYPIHGARIYRFQPCYDWYGKEKEEIAKLERGRRFAAYRIFLERITREVRHGGRMALIVEIAVPESPTGFVTIVAPHLESRCLPPCRRKQMEELLAHIRHEKNPVIIGGDLNTTGSDGAPTSIRRELAKRVQSPRFWVSQAISWFTPLAVPNMFVMPSNYVKNYLDPTAMHIPFVAPNGESGLFKRVEKFRFDDGRSFDFRGDPVRSGNGRGSTLGNSNQRAAKGFAPTLCFKRDYGGLMGRFKVDWILIAPQTRDPRDAHQSYWFAPHYPLTLADLNEAVPDKISDHHPIIADLPLINSDRLNTAAH